MQLKMNYNDILWTKKSYQIKTLKLIAIYADIYTCIHHNTTELLYQRYACLQRS